MQAISTEHSLIRHTGFAYFPVALVARLPFAMMIVGILTLVVSERGSLSLGGMTSAAVGAGTAIFGPLVGAAADRWGQRAVLLVTAVLNSAALAAIVFVARSTAPDWILLVAASSGSSRACSRVGGSSGCSAARCHTNLRPTR